MAMAMEAHRSEERSRPCRPPLPNTSCGITDLASLQSCHDQAYKQINQGLTADEQGKPDEARAFYESGLHEVNKALVVNCEQLNGTNEQKYTAKTIQQKLNKTKMQIQYRIQELKVTERVVPSAPGGETVGMDTDEPPSYEATMSGSVSDAQYALLGDSIMGEDNIDSQSLSANATEIFQIPNGVQIFFITPEGYISAPSYPTALKIFKFNEQEAGASSMERPSNFLQVGDWYYPLTPGASPVLQTNYGGYLFPDVTSATPGSSVGLMVPDTMTAAERQRFEGLMQSLTALRHQEVAPVEESQAGMTREREPETAECGAESTSTKISKGLITAAEYISWGVGKGAEKAGEYIRRGSVQLKARLKPEEARPIDPKIQQGVQYVRVGSHAAVKVSSYLVSKLGQATMYLAREAAPHIRKHGEKMLPKSLQQTSSSDGKSKIDGVIEVTASGLAGFGTVYTSLEKAAKALGRNLANETADVVGHKYGPDAGQLAGNTMYAAGNIALTAHNANNFGVKAVAKRAAKDTGKAVLQDIGKKGKQPQPDNDQGKPPGGNGHKS